MILTFLASKNRRTLIVRAEMAIQRASDSTSSLLIIFFIISNSSSDRVFLSNILVKSGDKAFWYSVIKSFQ